MEFTRRRLINLETILWINGWHSKEIVKKVLCNMDEIPLSPRRRLTYLESRERTFFSHKSPTILSLTDTKNKVRLFYYSCVTNYWPFLHSGSHRMSNKNSPLSNKFVTILTFWILNNEDLDQMSTSISQERYIFFYEFLLLNLCCLSYLHLLPVEKWQSWSTLCQCTFPKYVTTFLIISYVPFNVEKCLFKI